MNILTAQVGDIYILYLQEDITLAKSFETTPDSEFLILTLLIFTLLNSPTEIALSAQFEISEFASNYGGKFWIAFRRVSQIENGYRNVIGAVV